MNNSLLAFMIQEAHKYFSPIARFFSDPATPPPPIVSYLPYAERSLADQYQCLIIETMDKGRVERPIQGGETRSYPGAQMRFNMRDGFPLILERDARGIFKGALGEFAGFKNGARTLEALEQYGCPRSYWERWVTAEKCAQFGLDPHDLGPASYSLLHDYPARDGTSFNQVANLVDQMKRAPHLRTHRILPWYPPETIGPPGTRRVVVAPCHGDVQVTMFPDTRELIIDHVQRSGDILVGIPNNIVQYAAFGLELAKLTQYTFAEYIFTIRNAHIYECQYPFVEKLLNVSQGRFPTVHLTHDAPDDIFAFRPHHFVLSEYEPMGPKMKIPTPV